MRGKWLLFSGIVILLAIAAGAISVLRKPAPVPKKPEPVAPVAVDVINEVTLIGKIRAAHIVPVGAPVDGTLDQWMVEVGQEVLEDQELGHIKNTGLESAQERAEQELDRARGKVSNIEGSMLQARLEAARTDSDMIRTKSEASRLEKIYSREQLLFREGATARLKFEKAEKDFKSAQEEANTASELSKAAGERVLKLERDLEVAKKALDERTAELEDAQEDLKSSVIVAPIDGLIIGLGVEPGGEVQRATRDLLQIAVDPALLEIVVEPEPPALARIKAGQPAMVMIPDVMSDGLQGQVKEVKDKQVVVEFTSPNPAVKHGMTGSVKIRFE